MKPTHMIGIMLFQIELSKLEERIYLYKFLMDTPVPKELMTLKEILQEGIDFFNNAPENLSISHIRKFVELQAKKVKESHKRYELDMKIKDKVTQQ